MGVGVGRREGSHENFSYLGPRMVSLSAGLWGKADEMFCFAFSLTQQVMHSTLY